MAWYTAGSVSLTAGSQTVTGDGTSFIQNVKSGDIFICLTDGWVYEVGEIVSATQLTLKRPYAGTTVAKASYEIVPTSSYLKTLAAQVTDLIALYANIPSEVSASQAAAAASAAEAQGYRDTALQAQHTAEAARDTATSSRDAAAASARNAADSATASGTARDVAVQAKTDAQAARDTAQQYASTVSEIAAKAQSAYDASNSAVAQSGNAVSTANAAKSTADAAKSTADGLASSIATANANASSAVTAVTDETTRAKAAEAAAAALAVYGPVGQCYLARNGSNLQLARRNGKYVIVGSAACEVPAGGVTLAPTALAANTLYYVYAFMNGNTMTLECSTTGHATSATTGVEIKSGDASRTLVGMVYCNTAASFAAANSVDINLLSYFNRAGKSVSSGNTGQALNDTAWQQLTTLTWADEPLITTTTGLCYTASSGNTSSFYLSVDGVTVQQPVQVSQSTGAYNNPVAFPYTGTHSEGRHVVQFRGRNDGQYVTGTFQTTITTKG